MSQRIAIVGAGTAGLHLGLYLQQKGGQSTIFTDNRIEDYPNARLLNTVAHHAVTVTCEDDLGVNLAANRAAADCDERVRRTRLRHGLFRQDVYS